MISEKDTTFTLSTCDGFGGVYTRKETGSALLSPRCLSVRGSTGAKCSHILASATHSSLPHLEGINGDGLLDCAMDGMSQPIDVVQSFLNVMIYFYSITLNYKSLCSLFVKLCLHLIGIRQRGLHGGGIHCPQR